MGATERGGLRCWLALLAGLAPLLAALPARAEPFATGGAGLFLGYSFGEPGGFEWGLEGFATRYLEHHEECGDDSERHGYGPLLRIAALKADRLELTLAAHGGGELPNMRSYFGIDGEVGASLFLRSGRRWVAPHTGVTFESLIFNVYLRQEWLGPSISAGAGARYLPTFGTPGMCVEGRPYRDAEGRAQHAGLLELHGSRSSDPGSQRWGQRASEECASVPAFLQLALELSELRAPAALVMRAMQAAEEELGHARAALVLARLFGDTSLRLALPAFRPRPALPRDAALRRLVAETWLDGCLNEGLAAALAEAEGQETRLAEEAQICRQIAREEASHAALAFDVLAWAAEQAPGLVRSLKAPRHASSMTAGASSLRADWVRDIAQRSAGSAATRLAEISYGRAGIA